MNIDWKDALGALRNSGDLPIDDSPQEVAAAEKISQKFTVVIDKKGRKGKTATIIEGFKGPDEELEQLAKIIKQKLGTGGSARGGEILIQGDRKKDIIALLRQLGHQAK